MTIIMYDGADWFSIWESHMKVSREQVALNRERIVETAARLFRQKGYDGIGVVDLMKSAGLTHGGFYGHFASKEDLLAEATAHAFKKSVGRWRERAAAALNAPETAMASIGDSYLSVRHRDGPELGCSITSLGPDIARLGPKVRQALTEGAKGQIAVLEELVPGEDQAAKRKQALTTYAAMVGAIVLARAVDDEEMSLEILETVRASLPGT
ncbi:TetR/AcrR family transcriptional regulator [Burkholderia sp. LMU1-1-1.1]|uniref:TetR/AcrR family transcriptional regulator n=1 Tax=Burkholderia sp. LMU1-1-1.1 TaxID=3135266 RepID=UPI00343A5F6C